ncbi:MAG TPA: PHP domain-containing protein [Opitutaceae bacterium]|nr:PHP domain-containing protein [Opitutaceae bacterium]
MPKARERRATRPVTNAELARRLREAAQLLRAQGENPFKVRAYRRAADTVAGLSESVDGMVRAGGDLTRFSGIGKGIAAALREMVLSGKGEQLELSLAAAPPHLAALNEYPRLDPERVIRVYKTLGISTLSQLKEKFEAGVVAVKFGQAMHEHFRQAFSQTHQILLSEADELAVRVRRYLLERCGVTRVELIGEVRRRVEIVGELAFLIAADELRAVTACLRKYGGGIDPVEATENDATFQLPDSILVTLQRAEPRHWGLSLIVGTGSPAHLEELDKPGGALVKLAKSAAGFPDEAKAYRAMGLAWIPPELREGRNEVTLARRDELPELVAATDIRGDLHAHTTASDGSHTIEQMAAAAAAKGYEYLGITDHSQSLKIARGVSVPDLRRQIKRIDALNAKGLGIRLLKSAEVDILADGSLDYPDELLAELDYTVCSIHSRFRLGRTEQTERLLRAMDHPAFTMLGHATGRLLLRRPGYDLDFERVIAHAKAAGCFFEINATPDRLDLSAENVRLATAAGVKVAICTDAHHVRELDNLSYGIDVARRGGVEKAMVLNAMPWTKLRPSLAR